MQPSCNEEKQQNEAYFQTLHFFVLSNLPYRVCWKNKKFICAALIPEITYKHMTSSEYSYLPLARMPAVMHTLNKTTPWGSWKQYDFTVFAVCFLKNFIFLLHLWHPVTVISPESSVFCRQKLLDISLDLVQLDYNKVFVLFLLLFCLLGTHNIQVHIKFFSCSWNGRKWWGNT